ncbi:transposase [Streptomyces sp. NBC_01497]|uniref:transposase n=1 Tax=Streptomyces sp. NBC_01497 TaxID=2903885 RepID=UPI003FCE351E
MWGKWQLTLVMRGETRLWGIEVPLAVVDAGYGNAAALHLGVRGLRRQLRGGYLDHHAGPPRRSRNGHRAALREWTPTTCEVPDKPYSVKQLAVAAGRRAAKSVQWREASQPGIGRSSKRCTHGSWPCGSALPDARPARPPTARDYPSTGSRPSNPTRRTCPILALGPARRHPADHSGLPRQAPRAYRTRLPRDERGLGPGPLRGQQLERPAPPCHPRLRRPRLWRPATAGRSPEGTAAARASTSVSASYRSPSRHGPGPAPSAHCDIPTSAPT